MRAKENAGIEKHIPVRPEKVHPGEIVIEYMAEGGCYCRLSHLPSCNTVLQAWPGARMILYAGGVVIGRDNNAIGTWCLVLGTVGTVGHECGTVISPIEPAPQITLVYLRASRAFYCGVGPRAPR